MSFKPLLLATLLLTTAVTACGPRRVDVTTGAQAATEVALRVTNNLSQPVNVYVVNGGNETFIKQVSSKTSDVMNVPNIAAGTTVRLKATPADGSNSYTRDNVTLSGMFEWTVP